LTLLLVGTVTVLYASGAGRSLFGPTSYTKRVDVDRFYFRMKVSLTVDKTEPLEIDLVVGCISRVRTYQDNDRTVDIARDPRVYAVPTAKGHAVQVTTPDLPCRTGQTSDNHGAQDPHKVPGHKMYGVPQEYFPLVVWYESKHDLSLGIAYMSDDAYDSSLARLAFHKASIHGATEAEYRAFKEKGPHNLISPEAQVFRPSKDDERRIAEAYNRDQRSVWHEVFSGHCYGYYRLEANAALAEFLRKHMPADGRRYWAPEGDVLIEANRFLFDLQAGRGNFGPDGRLFRARPDEAPHPLSGWRWVSQDSPTTTAQRRDGRGVLSGAGRPLDMRGPYAPVYFPLRSTVGIPWLTAERLQDPSILDFFELEVEPSKQGFLYCYRDGRGIPGNTARKHLRVTGQEQAVARWVDSLDPRTRVFFDRDKYIFYRISGFYM
jgi:hypothetical protein